MKPCVVGIGGAGGNILKQFLQSMDANLVVHQFGEILSFGDVKGIWLESASQDALNQSYYGDFSQGQYPGYLICHGMVNAGSPTRAHIMNNYGLDIKKPGFDRRAEYLKAVFEIFEFDSALKDICLNELGYINPLSGYMWNEGIKPLTIISIGKTAVSSKGIDKKDEGSPGMGLSNLMSRMNRNGNKKFSKLCDSILFLASLGGGTGTGFINPITEYVRAANRGFPIFAIGVLTETGSDERGATEGKKFLGAAIAMYDLLTKEAGTGIDGLILVDNQIMSEKHKKNYPAMDSEIYNAFKPLLDQRNYPGYSSAEDSLAIRGVIGGLDGEMNSQGGKNEYSKNISNETFPPVLVPCYCILPDSEGDLKALVDGALGEKERIFPLGNDGRLFPCDPSKAERAIVFVRGFFKSEDIMTAVRNRTGLPESKIMIYRKLGDSKNNDILILLRNPYGGAPNEQERPGTMEWKLHGIIKGAIDYIIEQNRADILDTQDYTERTKESLATYFWGENGLRDELKNCLDRLERGEKPIFLRPLRIFAKGAGDQKAAENCKVGTQMAVDKDVLREKVRTELKEILLSEDCRRRIREIMQS
jgi:hypothetical protein